MGRGGGGWSSSGWDELGGGITGEVQGERGYVGGEGVEGRPGR